MHSRRGIGLGLRIGRAAVPADGVIPPSATRDLLRPGPAEPPPVPIPEVAPRGRPVPMPHMVPRGLPPVPMPEARDVIRTEP